jgi:hypothetical protein
MGCKTGLQRGWQGAAQPVQLGEQQEQFAARGFVFAPVRQALESFKGKGHRASVAQA